MSDRSSVSPLAAARGVVEDAGAPALEQEADAFHRALFGGPISPDLSREYARASKICLGEEAPASRACIDVLLLESLDVEAVEIAARWRDRDNLLTRKLRILSYLCEAQPTHQTFFVERRDRFWAASARLGLILLRSLYKWAKGRYLVWRYDVF